MQKWGSHCSPEMAGSLDRQDATPPKSDAQGSSGSPCPDQAGLQVPAPRSPPPPAAPRGPSADLTAECSPSGPKPLCSSRALQRGPRQGSAGRGGSGSSLLLDSRASPSGFLLWAIEPHNFGLVVSGECFVCYKRKSKYVKWRRG